jgi:hypothetical protein
MISAPVALMGVALALPQGVAVVVSRQDGLEPAESATIGDSVVAAITQSGLRVTAGPAQAAERLARARVSPVSGCASPEACAKRVGRALGAQVVVSVELGTLTDTVAVHLEARGANSGTRFAQYSEVVPRDAPVSAMAVGLEEFATQVREGAALLSRATAADRASDGTRVWPFVTGGLGLAAAGTAVTFLLLGLDRAGDIQRGTTADGRPFVGMPRDEAMDAAGTANRDYTLSIVAAATTAVLAALTVLLVSGSEPAEE